MGAASTYLVGKIYGNTLQGTSYTPPATVYVGLTVGGTEVSGGSYARVAVTANSTNFPVSGGTQSNNSAITFPSPTANWGTVTTFLIADAATSGNTLISASLTTSKTINNGDAAPSFASGALTWTIS